MCRAENRQLERCYLMQAVRTTAFNGIEWIQDVRLTEIMETEIPKSPRLPIDVRPTARS